jgi:glucose dehydrogenase
MNDIVLQLRSHNLVIAVDVPRRDDLSWASGPQSKAPIRPSALSCRRAHRGEEKNAATTEGSFSGVHRHSGSRARLSGETTTPAVAGATM